MAATGLVLFNVGVVRGVEHAEPAVIGVAVAAVHLAVVVTALAFVLWYSAVRRLGVGSAGLFTGVVPVTAALGGVLLGGPVPPAAVWEGTAVVTLGLMIGSAVPRAVVASIGGPAADPPARPARRH